MGENEMKLSSGQLYFTELGHVTAVECTTEENDISVPVASIVDVEVAFETLTKATKEIMLAITGMCQAVIECCPDKRVVHLALHGKKARTRKKNFNRAIKILEDLL